MLLVVGVCEYIFTRVASQVFRGSICVNVKGFFFFHFDIVYL